MEPSCREIITQKEDVKTLNNYLDTFQSRVFEANRRLVEDHQLVSGASIKDLLIGTDQRNKMHIIIFEDYYADVRMLIAIDYP